MLNKEKAYQAIYHIQKNQENLNYDGIKILGDLFEIQIDDKKITFEFVPKYNSGVKKTFHDLIHQLIINFIDEKRYNIIQEKTQCINFALNTNVSKEFLEKIDIKFDSLPCRASCKNYYYNSAFRLHFEEKKCIHEDITSEEFDYMKKVVMPKLEHFLWCAKKDRLTTRYESLIGEIFWNGFKKYYFNS